MTTPLNSPKHPGSLDQTSRARRALELAAGKIAPLWPLEDFVAVNPYMGLAHLTVQEAAETIARAAGARITLPRAHYARALQLGKITAADIEAALLEDDQGVPYSLGPRTASQVQGMLGSGVDWDPSAHAVKTVADVVDEAKNARWCSFLVDRISRWAAGHFDQGQALWPSPWRELSPFEAWKREASIDRSPEFAGICGARATIESLPDDAAQAAVLVLDRLGVPEAGRELYLHRLARTASGWIGHARYLDWQAELREEVAANAMEVLAIRLAWELVLFEAFASPSLKAAWSSARGSFCTGASAELRSAIAFDLLLMRAQEHATRRNLFDPLPGAAQPTTERPAAQAAFCIDVRSERLRRNLEGRHADVETLGFAGFFGVPLAVVPDEGGRPVPHCPALLAPRLIGSSEGLERAGVVWQGDPSTRAASLLERAWRSFKLAAVACFGFVETVGLAYAFKLARDGLGRAAGKSRRTGDIESGARPPLRLQAASEAGLPDAGELGVSERVDLAEGILRGMSLTSGFARLVAFVGHGASTTNNPYAASYHCGACGGHPGGANARVVAALMNETAVREGLAERGITIPGDTLFLAAQHDTTLDEVEIFDTGEIPDSHREELNCLVGKFEAACGATRRTRAPGLGILEADDLVSELEKRAEDWAQMRPEWGLAGCSAFIAAPRARTLGIDLGGAAFLHDYVWQEDTGFQTLESILTAPTVVASWISLQYSASAADNRTFGSGNKLLHNVVGRLGVLEGNGGDLRSGLPFQSIHDGQEFVHSPARLAVLVDAPLEAISAILARHENLAQLVHNGWIQLFAMNAAGGVGYVYLGDGRWNEMKSRPQTLAA